MSDPAAGTWEAPGGHLEEGETPRAAALREWQEECGLPVVDGEFVASWTSPDGVYMGFVYEIPREADLDIFARRVGSDPDGDVDGTESIAWWDPQDLPGNPAIRPELAASLDDVLAALGHSPDSGTVSKESVNYRPSQDPARCCGTCSMIRPAPDGYTCTLVQGAIDPGAVCDEWDPAGEGEVAKAADDRGPKGWPGWEHDLTAAAHWAAVLVAALTAVIGKAQAERIARAWLSEHPDGLPDGQGRREATDAAAIWLATYLDANGTDLTGTCQDHMPGIVADGWLIGGASAQAVTDDQRADWGGWQPGDDATARDRAEALGLGAGLGAALAASSQAAQEMARGYVTQMARALADGTLAGLGAAALGGAVFAALDDREYAARSVLAQLVIASGAAALAWYLARKVQQVAFVTAGDRRVCPRCDQCAAAGPYRLADAPEVPQHPACRCALVSL